MLPRALPARQGIRCQVYYNSLSHRNNRTYVHYHRIRYEMDKAYLRHVSDSDELHISFRYTNENLNVDRNFNFCRRMDEPVNEIMKRIRTNVEKELNKRVQYKNKKLIKAAKLRAKKNGVGNPTEENGTEAAATANINEATETATVTEQTKDPIVQLPIKLTEDIKIELLRSNSETSVYNQTFKELLQNFKGGLTLRIWDKYFDVVLNQPFALTVGLPSSILAGFMIYPSKMEIQFGSIKYSKGAWYRSKKPEANNKWSHITDGLHYLTKQGDIGYHLKFVFTPGAEDGCMGPSVEHICKWPVLAGPKNSALIRRQKYTKQALTDNYAIRVVTYNLLADLYADSDYSRRTLYPYCIPYALHIDYRKQLFIKELIGYNADIMCLQEVDLKVFDNDLLTVLPLYGFAGHFIQKGHCPEGLATFYRTSRFQKIKEYNLHLGSNVDKLKVFEPIWKIIKKNLRVATRVRERTTALQVTVLKCHTNSKYIIVANTHLYFQPDADHIRLLQIGLSMLYVQHIHSEIKKLFKLAKKHLNIVFCGDFNSVPECGIYQLFTEGLVDQNYKDWQSNNQETVSDVSLKQPFKMSSACGTPEFTNFTTLFVGCLDYIFYQNDHFDLLQSVPLPTNEEVSNEVAIPSSKFPSDHVALIADLKFKTK